MNTGVKPEVGLTIAVNHGGELTAMGGEKTRPAINTPILPQPLVSIPFVFFF
jgi:hypothetical protein